MDARETNIYKASVISIAGNAFLAVLKIAAGIISGSLAVIGDGIDSATDIAASVITMITARIISKPPNIKYPYGYKKADSLAAKVLAFIIFFAGAQLAISSITKLIEGYHSEVPSMLAIYITIVSIAGKLLLSVYLKNAGKTLQSPMLSANAKNMQNDILTSVSVLTGLIFTHILNLPVIDLITAIAISFWIMKSAFDIFMHSTYELMDGNENPDLYREVFAIVNNIHEAHNPHRARIRKIGNLYNISIDIEVDGTMPLNEAHKIAHKVEKALRTQIEFIYDIVVHVEPIGEKEHHRDEKFGISEEDLK